MLHSVLPAQLLYIFLWRILCVYTNVNIRLDKYIIITYSQMLTTIVIWTVHSVCIFINCNTVKYCHARLNIAGPTGCTHENIYSSKHTIGTQLGPTALVFI